MWVLGVISLWFGDGRHRIVESMIALLESWLSHDVESVIAQWNVGVIESSSVVVIE